LHLNKCGFIHLTAVFDYFTPKKERKGCFRIIAKKAAIQVGFIFKIYFYSDSPRASGLRGNTTSALRGNTTFISYHLAYLVICQLGNDHTDV